MKTKICSKCHIEKPISEFGKAKKGKYGVRGDCIECVKKYQKEYRNKEENKQKAKEYREKSKNKEKKAKNNKEYWKNNREEIAKQNKKYRDKKENKIRCNQRKKIRYHTDINYKITKNLRNRIYAVLKGNYKSKSTMKLLGCTIEELKIHLESKFTKGMNWNNCGLNGWEIDHKLPCDSFDLSKKSEQNKCFNYTNLQPLWAKDNRSKGSKILKQGNYDSSNK